MTAPALALDAPGTCHLVGCPEKGQHAPHGIGAPDTFAAYTEPAHCIGFPVVRPLDGRLFAICSIAYRDAFWLEFADRQCTPADMAAAVDRHRLTCTNRAPRGA